MHLHVYLVMQHATCNLSFIHSDDEIAELALPKNFRLDNTLPRLASHPIYNELASNIGTVSCSMPTYPTFPTFPTFPTCPSCKSKCSRCESRGKGCLRCVGLSKYPVYGNVVCNNKVHSIAGCPMCNLRWTVHSEKAATLLWKYRL